MCIGGVKFFLPGAQKQKHLRAHTVIYDKKSPKMLQKANRQNFDLTLLKTWSYQISDRA